MTEPTADGAQAAAPPSDAAKARQPILDRYADGGLILTQAVANLSPEHARARPGPGAWSVVELAAHLVDSDLVFADRIKRIVAEDNPTLLAYPEDAWLERLGSARMSLEDAAALFAANRRWVDRILRGLDDADFRRTGTHTELGRQTLVEVVVKAVHHLDHHLKFLYAKRAKLGVAIYPRYAANPGF